MQEPKSQKISPMYVLIAQHLHFFGQPVDLLRISQAAEEIMGNTTLPLTAKPRKTRSTPAE